MVRLSGVKVMYYQKGVLSKQFNLEYFLKFFTTQINSIIQHYIWCILVMSSALPNHVTCVSYHSKWSTGMWITSVQVIYDIISNIFLCFIKNLLIRHVFCRFCEGFIKIFLQFKISSKHLAPSSNFNRHIFTSLVWLTQNWVD